MQLGKLIYVDHPKYDARIANGINSPVGFYVKIFLIYSDERVYTLFNRNDWIDNINLMRENGSQCTSFTYDLLVTPTNHTSIYEDISNYVSETHLH